ncbi:hypothetical protein AK812_SmicGene44313 [Symbiodinium microadriaticum]|uniref:Uncharacterized protein n=1 Tax=Symbiodinium microadriaticum TaxID=2951 RepID=A0A1Q9BYV5_SYMMI|nr:hypothetical protein AK812_SmicGene44313 [Symbiodinium microadriaticum]
MPGPLLDPAVFEELQHVEEMHKLWNELADLDEVRKFLLQEQVAQDAMQTAMRRKELVMKVMGQQQQGAAKAKAPHIDEDTVLEDTMRDDVDDIDILLKDLDAQMQESQQIQEATQKSPRDEATEAPRQGVEKPPEVTTGKDPAGQGVEKPPEVTTGKDPAGQGVEKPQEVTTEKDPAGRGVEKPGLEVTAEKDPGQGVEKPLEVKAEKDPGQGVEKPQADSEKASVQGEVQAGSAESHLVSWLLTSLKGHQGSGSGTGEPSAIEQALKRPGTVDFEQLLAGLNNKINAGTKQQDGKLPAPQDEVPPSAPSTPAPTTPAQSIAAENAPMKAPASIEPDRADAPMKPPAAIEPDVVEDRKLKRNAYMRFSRSLTSPNCPEAVLEAYDKCKDSTGRARRDKVQEGVAGQWMDNPDAPDKQGDNPPPPPPPSERVKKEKSILQQAKAMNLASNNLLEVQSFEHKLKNNNLDSNLVMALVQSMNSQAELLRTARSNLEAAIACQDSDENVKQAKAASKKGK